jgi:hypothetical protein
MESGWQHLTLEQEAKYLSHGDGVSFIDVPGYRRAWPIEGVDGVGPSKSSGSSGLIVSLYFDREWWEVREYYPVERKWGPALRAGRI